MNAITKTIIGIWVAGIMGYMYVNNQNAGAQTGEEGAELYKEEEHEVEVMTDEPAVEEEEEKGDAIISWGKSAKSYIGSKKDNCIVIRDNGKEINLWEWNEALVFMNDEPGFVAKVRKHKTQVVEIEKKGMYGEPIMYLDWLRKKGWKSDNGKNAGGRLDIYYHNYKHMGGEFNVETQSEGWSGLPTEDWFDNSKEIKDLIFFKNKGYIILALPEWDVKTVDGEISAERLEE